MSEVRSETLDLERIVLASAIYDSAFGRGRIVSEVLTRLGAEDYGERWFARLHRICQGLHSQGVALEMAALASALEQREAERLGEMVDAQVAYHPATILKHIKAIRLASKRRQALALLADHQRRLMSVPLDGLDQAVSELQADVFTELGAPVDEQIRVVTLREAVKEASTEILERVQDPQEVPWTATGIERLDKVTRGLKAGHSYILGAESGHGKSVMAMAMSTGVARSGGKVLFVAYEMPAASLGSRVLSAESQINGQLLVTGMVGQMPDGPHRMMAGTKAISAYGDNMRIVDGQASLVDLRRILRAWESELRGPVDLVVIDYVQIMPTSGRQANRERELAHLAEGLTSVARAHKTSVLMLSQVNSDRHKRGSPVPGLRDYRECKALAHPCSVAIQLYRPGPDGQPEVWKDRRGDEHPIRDLGILRVVKNRMGVCGSVPVKLHLETQSVLHLSDREIGND